ncbi:uncharacterized protein LOC133840693 isoform X3 [Drosophila sulfurigaster albostrigata]|uniref:uncharacterized protein LOC133840693 isoform X3 n=1 Tax=Drosophila sulfurigaster albostrigata TaxID=89887 RepID=UPI002D219726|nr:uncharacterized protein LOC133840693 isoform X3 [Drosophila sulfurigaster albostrigata]
MPECEVFGMMSSQDLLEEQRNINERLGSLERKVDFLINLHVDKLCEDAKEVVEPTEFPIKSTGDEEEDESYENPEYKTTSKKRSIEKSTPTPAKRATNSYILHRRIQNENESEEKLLALPDFRETLAAGLMTYKNKTLPGCPIKTKSASSPRWANQSPSSQSGRTINSPSLQTDRAKKSPLSDRPYQHALKHGQKSKHPIPDLRFDQLNHFPHWLDRNSGKRFCKHCKTSQTQCICTKCNLHLCCSANKNCFVEYHKKK